MEIYLKILKKNLTLILVFSVMVAFVVGFLTSREGTRYDVSLSISVSRSSSPEYAGFYAGQASKLFTDTIASWLKAPEIISEVYKRAGLSLPGNKLQQLRNVFDLEGSASQHLKISFREYSRERAEKVAAAIPEVIQKEGNALFKENDRFLIMATNPLILEKKPPVLLNTAIAFFVVVIILFFVGLVIEYFNEEKRKDRN